MFSFKRNCHENKKLFRFQPSVSFLLYETFLAKMTVSVTHKIGGFLYAELYCTSESAQYKPGTSSGQMRKCSTSQTYYHEVQNSGGESSELVMKTAFRKCILLRPPLCGF